MPWIWGVQSASGKWEETICMLGIVELPEEMWLEQNLGGGEGFEWIVIPGRGSRNEPRWPGRWSKDEGDWGLEDRQDDLGPWDGMKVQWLVSILWKVKVKVARSCLTVTSWTVAYQAPLSIGFSRQEYWSGLPCPLPGDLPHSGMEPSIM